MSLSPSPGYPTKKIACGFAPAKRPPNRAAATTMTTTTMTAIAIHNAVRFGAAFAISAAGGFCSSINDPARAYFYTVLNVLAFGGEPEVSATFEQQRSGRCGFRRSGESEFAD